jgi:GNAT superfamily N-acetyltransferase
MVLSYRIREAALDDNQRLIELVRRCPIKGSVQVILDRHPDYFAMTRMQGDRSYIYVAENMQGELVGSVAFVERTEYQAQQAFKVLHFSDLRTDPAYRRTRIAAKFIEIYRQKLLEEGYHYGMAEILEGNVAPVKAQRLLGEGINVVPRGAMDLYQLLPLWPYRSSQHYRTRTATPEDVPRIADLLQQCYRHVSGIPPFTVEWLERATQQHASFGVGDIWLAENQTGELLACVATWDQKGLRKTIATRFSRSMRIVVRILALLGLVWRLPPTPVEGEPLRYLYLRWPASRPGQGPALNALIKRVMREVRSRGEHQFVAVGFHEKDRLRTCLRGIVRIKSRIHLYMHQVKSTCSVLPAGGDPLPFVDPGLI